MVSAGRASWCRTDSPPTRMSTQCISMTRSYPSIPCVKETFLQMRSCPDTLKVSPYAPCAPSGCHLCLQCPPRPLGLTECLPHLLLVILSSWLPPPPAPLLVSCGSWDTPAFSRAAALLDPLHHCAVLLVGCISSC